jgi:hypothetical protein
MQEHQHAPAETIETALHDNGVPTPARDREACTPADLDALRFEVARVNVMAEVAMDHFSRTVWHEADDAPARIDFVAHLVVATAESASAALLAVDDLRRAMVNRSTVPSGEIGCSLEYSNPVPLPRYCLYDSFRINYQISDGGTGKGSLALGFRL